MLSHVMKSALLVVTLGCTAHADQFVSQWHRTNDRVWLGGDYWANPMEDWRIHNGVLECTRSGANRNVHLLTRDLNDAAKPFTLSVKLGRVDGAKGAGSAGFRIGIRGEIDDYRHAALFGTGIDAGITSDGRLFIGQPQRKATGRNVFPPDGVELRLVGKPNGQALTLTLTAHDIKSGEQRFIVTAENVPREKLAGNIALVNNFGKAGRRGQKPTGFGTQARFWFRNLKVSGEKVQAHPDRAFGPILWAMHTLSDSRTKEGHVLKITAQMPPLGEKDEQRVYLKRTDANGTQKTYRAKIDKLSRTATFRIPNWDATKDHAYQLHYPRTYKDGEKADEHIYKGTIRRDPIDRPLVVAGFTGNQDYAFPNNEIVGNLEIQNPDVLFFSGDQIYEGVGGYGIHREPTDLATLNYLRKWYLLGWSFGDLMRDRPTICLPDDHDVYHGNIWGEAGMKMPKGGSTSTTGGYRQPAAMVNAVHRTQCSHHPDFFDKTPIKQGISVYYGDMVYGRVSFAIISDRQFKSAPGHVTNWKGRADHLKDPKYDVSKLDKEGLQLLGERQENFLEAWAADWRGADMKCLLSQTIFCNLANYHGGNQEFIFADLDSNGWPQTPRNRAVALMRKALAFHYAGDQHLPSIVHHGIDTWNDAGYSFCVPSIAAGYPRSWKPDDEGRKVQNRPAPGLPNTGEYRDAFGHPITVHGIGNPAKKNRPGRINTAHDKSSGHGIVRFNQQKQTITMECWRLQFDAKNPKKEDQFPGWPKTIHMTDNDGRQAKAWLPTINVSGLNNPVVQVIHEATGETLYTLRVRGNRFKPKVFKQGKYTLNLGEQGTPNWKSIKGVRSVDHDSTATLNIEFQP